MRGRGRAGALAVALLCAALILAPRPALAVYECGGVQDTCQCGVNNFCICCDWSGQSGNCVWYAWHMACCNWGVGLEWCTNADTWDGYATNYGYTLLTEPCEHTIFVCEANTSQCGSGSVGHVGWVTSVYADGSIDVEEQGCYSFDGVQTRHFAAQNASPTMHYIYEPGVTSCSQCECNPGDVETRGCPNCGTESRTCGGNCAWGSWGSCQGQGVCEAGTQQGCGSCGGTQSCESSCQWGACVETCPDAAVSPDAAPAGDGGVIPTPDGGLRPDGAPPADGLTTSQDAGSAGDGGGEDPGTLVRGGCACRTSNSPGLFLPLGLFMLWLAIRRRIK
ncbi:MAG: CHAP domain-containing protein [bacterium]